MIVFFLLILLLSFTEGHCVYEQNYWRTRPLEEWPSSTQNQALCGQSWYIWLQSTNETLWNTTIREIVVSSLNNCSYILSQKTDEVLKGMVSYCNNRERWQEAWEIILPRLMGDVINFNRGTVEHPLCSSIHRAEAEVDQIDQLFSYLKVLTVWSLFLTLLVLILAKKVFIGSPQRLG